MIDVKGYWTMQTARLSNGELIQFDYSRENGDDVLFFRDPIGLVGGAKKGDFEIVNP